MKTRMISNIVDGKWQQGSYGVVSGAHACISTVMQKGDLGENDGVTKGVLSTTDKDWCTFSLDAFHGYKRKVFMLVCMNFCGGSLVIKVWRWCVVKDVTLKSLHSLCKKCEWSWRRNQGCVHGGCWWFEEGVGEGCQVKWVGFIYVKKNKKRDVECWIVLLQIGGSSVWHVFYFLEMMRVDCVKVEVKWVVWVWKMASWWMKMVFHDYNMVVCKLYYDGVGRVGTWCSCLKGGCYCVAHGV